MSLMDDDLHDDSPYADEYSPGADVCPDCGTALVDDPIEGFPPHVTCPKCDGTDDRLAAVKPDSPEGDDFIVDRPAVTVAMIDAAMDKAYEHMPSYFGGSEEEDREYIATLIAAALEAAARVRQRQSKGE